VRALAAALCGAASGDEVKAGSPGANGAAGAIANHAKAGIVKTDFGKTKEGEAVDLYTLTNKNGLVAKITNYGGIVTELHVPDTHGTMGDIVLGYKTVEEYIKGSPYFGALIGRFGNRIAKGKFTLEGKEYSLATNNGPNHLHGGIKGFDKVVWKAEPMDTRRARR
jgi:aldose 1-epimerase